MLGSVALVLRMAKENASWGYTRIRGALFNIGYEIGSNTINGNESDTRARDTAPFANGIPR